MKKAILLIVAFCGAVGWIVNRLSVITLLCFMEEKGYTPPTESELKACSREAVKRMFTLNWRDRH